MNNGPNLPGWINRIIIIVMVFINLLSRIAIRIANTYIRRQLRSNP